jgi:hypothetical protein
LCLGSRRTPLQCHALSAMVVVVVIVVITVITVMIVAVIMAIIVPVLAILATHLVLFTTDLVFMLLVLAHLMAEVFFALALMALLARRVHVVVPALRYKVDRPAAGVVFAAVTRPMPLITGRYMQVQGRRRRGDDLARGYGYHRSRHDELRRRDVTADRELPVNTGSIQIDGDTHVTGERDRLDGQRCGGACGDADDPGGCGLHSFPSVLDS